MNKAINLLKMSNWEHEREPPGTGWIDLLTYSHKYNVSKSTITRKIQRKEVEIKRFDGKYWVRDNDDIKNSIYKRRGRPSLQASTTKRSAGDLAPEKTHELALKALQEPQLQQLIKAQNFTLALIQAAMNGIQLGFKEASHKD